MKPLTAVLLAILIASCGGAPGVSVLVGTERVSTVPLSATRSVGCAAEHGDAFPQEIPLTRVRTPTPVRVRFEAGQGATEIRGWIYDVDPPSPSGSPVEEFALRGGIGIHEARTITAGRTYRVVVNVKWSVLIAQGEETHAFRLRVEPP